MGPVPVVSKAWRRVRLQPVWLAKPDALARSLRGPFRSVFSLLYSTHRTVSSCLTHKRVLFQVLCRLLVPPTHLIILYRNRCAFLTDQNLMGVTEAADSHHTARSFREFTGCFDLGSHRSGIES